MLGGHGWYPTAEAPLVGAPARRDEAILAGNEPASARQVGTLDPLL